MNSLERKISSATATIGVIGLGYIGLSLLEAFGKAGYPLIGFDINEEKVNLLKKKKSYLNFMDLTSLFMLLGKKKFTPTNDPSLLKNADVLIISVPTSLDRYHVPDLSNLRAAFKTVAASLKKGQLIVLQSSTYPGTTEEELLPLLEKSHLTMGKDIFLSHVPEVADIGNPHFNFTEVPRLVSGITPSCRKMAALLYQKIGCEIVLCPSTAVAEAAKLLQNGYRLINISFINEMKIMFDKMKIDIWEVIEAAKSKPFGFTPFEPSPGIGGDCIPIAPLYLVWKAKLTEGPTTLLEQASHVNDSVHIFVFNKVLLGLNQRKKSISSAKILILGVGYKKNVNDIRESAGLELLFLLREMKADVYYHDPFVPEISHLPAAPKLHLKSVKLIYEDLHLYDAVVIITDHSFYNWQKIGTHSALIIDTRNVMQGIKNCKAEVIKA